MSARIAYNDVRKYKLLASAIAAVAGHAVRDSLQGR